MPNATLDSLSPRGAVAGSDLVPILPAGGATLLSATAAALKAYALAGSGAMTGLVVITPSGDVSGATDTAAIQSALNTGADVYLSPGVFVTNATLTLTTTAQHGQRLFGAGPTSQTGLGAGATIIRPTAAVTTAILIDGTAFAGYIQQAKLDGFTIDLANLPDTTASVAINQVQAYDCGYDRVGVINFGTAKVSWLFTTGAYVASLTTCKGGLVRFNGASLNNATTTMTLTNCDITWIDHNYYVNVTFVGGAVQRPYDATVPIIYLAPGTTPYGYLPNTGGLYAAVMSKIDNSLDFSSIGCDWEQAGGYPATYNDGVHGVLTLIRVVQVTANATNTVFINPQFAGCYLLDAGINTRVIGYQTVGINLASGKDYHFNDIPTSANIIGFTDFANYFGSGLTSTYTIAAATGGATFRTTTLQPAADGDGIFLVKTAGALSLFDIATNGGGAVNAYNGAALKGYSDTGSTQTFEIQSATGIIKGFSGGVEKWRVTPSNASINVASGGFYSVNGVYVVSGRQTGWGAASGTTSRAAYAAYAGQTFPGTYTQANEQSLDNAVKLLSQTVVALISDLTTHGLIGP